MKKQIDFYELRDALSCELDCLGDNELIQLHNDYCEMHNYYDSMVYDIELFNDFMYGKTPLEIVESIDDFNPYESYISCDGLGYINSSNDPKDFIDTDELASEMLDDCDVYDILERFHLWEDFSVTPDDDIEVV